MTVPTHDHDRLTTPFGFHSTTTDVLDGVDLRGTRVVVTGGASGIGVETARALAAAGAEVTIAARDLDAARTVSRAIADRTGNHSGRAAHLDLVDRVSIARFAAQWDGPLHVLVNNAGIMALPELHRTDEGWELQFATNHLGHFELAVRLHEALARAEGARVVALSSNAHRRSPVVFDDVHFEHRPYEAWSAYGQSKTANALFAVGAAARWAGEGITANAVMPGGIRTKLQQHQLADLTPEVQEVFDNYRWKTVEEGAATSVLVAASPLVAGVSGRYFEDCNEADRTTGADDATGVAPYALDEEAADRLWEYSLRALGH